MPSLTLPHSTFLHNPKTGGQWVTIVLRKMLQANRFPIDHADRFFAPRGFRFAFVRDPVTWIRSAWTSHVARRVRSRWPVWFLCRSTNFTQFIHNLYREFPNGMFDALPHTFDAFVGPPDDPIEFIGKQENLREDLIAALRAAGESVDEQLIRMYPQRNAARRLPAYTPATLDLVLEKEAPTRARFGYTTIDRTSLLEGKR